MEEQTQNKTQQKQENTTNKGGRYALKRFFSAKRMAVIAVFSALAFVVSLFDFPIFPATPFLKLDFGNVFIVLISFLLGPVEGLAVCALKEGFRLIGSTSNGAGEIANFLMTGSYLLLPSILYQYRRNLKTVVFSLLASCVIATGVALIANRFIIFPAFAALGDGTIFGNTVPQAFALFWVAILLFNLIKTVAVGILTMLLYKRLSNFLKKMKI
jgi:riboflavin transporter FmnP